MDRLHSLVRSAHAIGTHQRLVVDALPHVKSAAGHRLVRWLLYHHRSMLRGAVDPDERFRDFHNHILHVADGYWGGAPRVAHQWYDRLVTHLIAERFDRAAHAAGVLSHYITDVIQPLHTVSNDREALIHRPFEWSVDRSYRRIMRQRDRCDLCVRIKLSNHPAWLGSLMMHLARRSHRYSDTLADRYRFREAIEDPRRGFDGEAITILAELFALAITALAQVIDRAALEVESEIGQPIAHCHGGWAWIGAITRLPISLCRRYVRGRKESWAVRALADEYYRTGRLVRHLPAEVDIKRRVIAVYRREGKRRPGRRLAA